jgi:lipopolysaccharide transport system ATP-binding protein
MEKEKVIEINGLSKLYRLGVIGTGTLSHDLNRIWARMRRKEDPYRKLGSVNNRESAGSAEYVWSLKEVNFQVNKGEVVGIIGKNGAGKSTLLKVLSRVTGPSEGSVRMKGRLASLLEVGTGFHPELTARENIYLNGAILGMTKSEIDNKFDEIVEFSGVNLYIDTPVKRFSSGMYVRLAFAVAAHLEPEILIVDEVLAVGDAEFQRKCIGKMKDVSGEGRTVLFVSHNMSSIKTLCTRVIYLENGKVVYDGDVHGGIQKYLKTDITASSAVVEVDSAYRVLDSGKVHYTKASLLDELNRAVAEVNYRQSIILELEFEVMEPITNVLFDLYLYSEEGISVAYAIHNHNGDPLQSLNKGRYKTEVHLMNHLLPGKYFINLGIHENSGKTIESVQGLCKFEVLRTASGEATDYEYSWNNSHTRADSEWKFSNL